MDLGCLDLGCISVSDKHGGDGGGGAATSPASPADSSGNKDKDSLTASSKIGKLIKCDPEMVEMKEEEQEKERMAVIKGKEEALGLRVVNMFVAMALWLGAIHFNVALIVFSICFLPISKAILVFGLLILFMIVPVDDKSKIGRKVSRYICKYACGYFPVTMYVEDKHVFDPDRSNVFGYEPHSVLPIGVGALADMTGILGLPKIKVLASSALGAAHLIAILNFPSLGAAPLSHQRRA